MFAPKKPKEDPGLQEQQQRAERDNIDALKIQMQGDTASLLARYGTRLALANTGSTASIAAPIMGMSRG